MERNIKTNDQPNALNDSFNCNKMRSLISGDETPGFSERFRNWLKAYTKDTREKIWVDIESYKAG